MKKQFGLFVLVLLASINTLGACDVCGGTANAGVGLLSTFQYNMARIQLQQARFRATEEPFSDTSDDFYSISIVGQWYATPRLRVLATVPYRYNFRSTADGSRSLSGVGDVQLQALFAVVDHLSFKEDWEIHVEAGGGFSLPTGRYDHYLPADDLPRNFNVGTGAFGYLFQVNTILEYRNSGLILNANRLAFWENEFDYEFGTQWFGSVLFFQQIPIKSNVKLSPFAGIYAEHIDQNEFFNGTLEHGTSGHSIQSTLGFNCACQDWVIGATWMVPIQQTIADSEIEARYRMSFDLSYFF